VEPGIDPKTPAFDLPVNFLERFMESPDNSGQASGAGADAQEGGEEAPVVDGEELDRTGEDNDEAGEQGEGEDEGEEAGEGEGEDEGGEEDEPEESDEDDEGKGEDDFLTPETLKKHQKRIESDPSLKAVYQQMRADYTRKTQEVAEQRKEITAAGEELLEFEQTLMDVTESGGRETWLIDAALDNPDVFQRAFDRAADILADPDKKKQYERERTVSVREQNLKPRERVAAEQEMQQRIAAVHRASDQACVAFGIKDEAGITVAKKYVARVILANRQAGEDNITAEQIRAAVKEAASDLRQARGKVEEDVKRKGRQEKLEEAKKTIRDSKRPPPPGGRAPSVLPPKVPKVETGRSLRDPLDSFIDQKLGVKSR
jgi:hypothetical protein